MAREREMETYSRLLGTSLAAEGGRYALIAGTELLGVFDSYNEANNAGYHARGLQPFLVKRIASAPTP